MQSIINTVGTIETGNTRFACQHVYHSDCLSRYNLYSCLMCKGINENASVTINNYDNFQVINEEQIKNFIKNLQNIYPPQELKFYAQTYPQEYNNFNDGLMLGLLTSSWHLPPVVIVNNGTGYEYNDYGGNNIYNQQNIYSGDPNPDSAVGGFQSNNIEMKEINNGNNNENIGGGFGNDENNNSNIGGNFGGYGNNNENIEGNFGEEANNNENIGGSFGDDGNNNENIGGSFGEDGNEVENNSGDFDEGGDYSADCGDF